MARQKLTERNSVTTSTSDDYIHIVKGGLSYKIKKGDLLSGVLSGFVGSLASTDATVTEDGIYICSDSGTYTNNGGLVVDLTTNLTFISVEDTQTTFVKIELPVSSFGYNVVTSLANFDSLITGATSGTWLILDSFALDANKTIPTDVTLEFRGGIISGGGFTLTGDDTSIVAEPKQIFDVNVLFNGEWNIDKVYSEWFGAVGDGTTNDYDALQVAILTAQQTGAPLLKLLSKVYSIESPIKWWQGVNIEGASTSAGTATGTEILCNFSAGTIATPPTDIYTNTYVTVLDYTPMIYNVDGVTTQMWMTDVRINGNSKDVYGLYQNEMYYTNLDRIIIKNCNKSPLTIVKAQFCQFGQISVTSCSAPIRIIGSSGLVINALDVESMTLEDSWLQIYSDINKQGILINNLWYEEQAGGTGVTNSDFITIGQRGVRILSAQITTSGTGAERYVNLVAGGTSYTFDGVTKSTNASSDCVLASNLVEGNNKLKIGSDATELLFLGKITTSQIDTFPGTGRFALSPMQVGNDFEILSTTGGVMVDFSDTEVNILGVNFGLSGADRTIKAESGRLTLQAGTTGGAAKDMRLQAGAVQIYDSAGSSSAGDWADGLFRLGGYYMWFNASGKLMRSTSKSLPTSDSDGVVIGTQT